MKKSEANAMADLAQTAKERLEKEHGAIIKTHDDKLSVALVYPNKYEVGMANLGFQKVYHLLNQREDVVCERAFLPSSGQVDFLKKEHTPLFSMETSVPLKEFDVIAFSVTFEEDYINVLTILESAGILFDGRAPGDPVIAMGGIAPTLNPEVMAKFIDVFFIGEAESIIDPFCNTLIDEGFDKTELAKVAGVYIPSGYEPVYNSDDTLWRYAVGAHFPERVTREWNSDFHDNPNRSYLETEDSVFGDMSLVEVGKGCGRHCRFCAAGYVYRPTRYAEVTALFETIAAAIEKKGKVGLVGSAVADHPDIEWILDHIVSRGAKFSVSSLRLDLINERILESLVAGDCNQIAVAPEAGTEKLRRRINKDMDDEVIILAMRRIASTWPFHVKLYFLVGLPGETIEDVVGIVELVKKMQEAMVSSSKRRGTIGSITVSVDAFVPKPSTPFQWEPFAGIGEIKKRLKIVRKGLGSVPNVKVTTGSAKKSFIQTVLSVGDRRVGDIIERAYRLDGDWFKAFGESKEKGFDPAFIAMRRKGVDENLPWSIIDNQLYGGYLSKELGKSSKEEPTPACPDSSQSCKVCGVFDGYCSHKM